MRHSLAVAFVAALALSAACNRDDANAGAPGSNTNTNSGGTRREQTPPARTNESTKTPDQRPLDQSNNQSNAVDMRITQDIHKALTDTSDLSVNAKNIKVACMNGTVTLTGGVDSTTERDRVEAIATGIAGVTRVDNQIEVKTPR